MVGSRGPANVMSAPSMHFVYATCSPACQALVKHEVAIRYPELRFAFSRPGFVSWKAPRALPSDFDFRLGLARRVGFGFGPTLDPSVIQGWLDAFGERRAALHVFSRPAPEEQPERSADELEHIERGLRDALGEALLPPDHALVPGDVVLDVVVPRESESEEAWFVGFHRHALGLSSLPGGPRASSLPEVAPSRAYCKIEEAISWQALPFERGQTVLELGSAPGGATYALLERGLHVIGVDPGDMDERVAPWADERGLDFLHLKKPAHTLVTTDLPRPADWLLSDMNLAPQVAVTHVAHALALVKRSVRGAVVTLKMNDLKAVASLPALEKRLATLGLGSPRLVQLPSHRKELVAVLRRS